MRVPADKKAINLLLNGFIIAFDDDLQKAYLIESVEPSAELPNVAEVSGRDLRALLSYRIVPRTETYSGVLGDRIYWIINHNAVEPHDPDGSLNTNRVIPYLQNLMTYGSGAVLEATKQYTGDNVMDAIIDMLSVSDFGWDVLFYPETKEIIPVLYEGFDSVNTSSANLVIYDDALGSMDNVGYIRDITNYKTVATIAGEGEGNDRVFTGIDITGGASGTISGFERKEMFVDARDIQSKTQDDEGNETKIPAAQYSSMLQQRGWEKLCENKVETKMEVNLNESHYRFNATTSTDIGKIVAFRSHGQLGISGTCRIVAAEVDGTLGDYDSERTVSLTVEVLTMEVMQ